MIRWTRSIRLGAVAAAICIAAAATQFAGMVLAEPAAKRPNPITVSVTQPKAAPKQAPQPVAQPAVVPAEDAYVIKRVLPIGGPLKFGDTHWDENGAPKDGTIIITVDLKAQTLSVFRDGYEIGATAILYGSDEKPTPTGVYPISQKKVHHISNLYDAEMPYMQRLTNDGVAIHASNVRIGYATHGCIGVPIEFAKKLFGVTKLGDRVIVTNGEMLKQGDSITAD